MIARRFAVLSLVTLLSAPLYAQDTGTGRTPQPRPKRVPGDDDPDRKLDDSLKHEFDTPPTEVPPGERPPPPPPPPREREPVEAPPPPRDDKKTELGLRVGALAGHYSASVFNVRIASRKHDVGTGRAVEIEDTAGIDLQRAETQVYRGWAQFGFFGLRFNYTSTLYRDNGEIREPFDFATAQWNVGTPVAVRLETQIIDVDADFRPVATPLFDVDVLLGVRYVWGATQLKTRIGPAIDVGQSQWNWMPMVGIEGTVKPVPNLLSFYLRLQGGGFGYRVTHGSGAGDFFTPIVTQNGPSSFINGSLATNQSKHQIENNFFSYEVEVGGRLLYEDHVGVAFGYRLDAVGMLWETNSNRSRLEFSHEGPFIAFIAQY